jgi:hypothetical protein
VDATTVSTSSSVTLAGGRAYRWSVAAGNADGLSAFTTEIYFYIESTLQPVRRGLDYAFAPRPTASGVKSAGYSFVVRYVGGSASKQITLSEAQSLKAAAVDLILVFESTATRMQAGFNAGVTDANTAVSQALAAGAPQNFFCYFACDFDAQLSDQPAINDYLDGAASVLGSVQRVGFYGGYNPVKRVLDAGKAAKGWQTLAWSSGLKDHRISLFQTGATVTIDGAVCDVDEGYGDQLGQWAAPSGSLQVTLAPSDAATGGAQWSLDNGPFRASGTSISGLTTGSHLLTFKTIPGFFTPANRTVEINSGPTTVVSATYFAMPPVQLVAVALENGSVHFDLTGAANVTYIIEAAADFTNWSPISTNTIPASGVIAVNDPSPALEPARFYRAVQKP